MSAELYRKYLDIINENSQPKVQLDEGVMDMLNPYIKKAANALMSKFDPQTLQGLKQAYDQSGGDKNKFMSMIGITQQDLAPLAKGGQSVAEAKAGTFFGTGSSLKSKVLTGLFNIVPLLGLSELLTNGAIGHALNAAGHDILTVIFYIISAALIWGVGHYDFGDMDKKSQQLPSNTRM
jgi:hypothetical protein